MDQRQPRGRSGFDETDALIVFDDVFVPWERVFVCRERRVAQMNGPDTLPPVRGILGELAAYAAMVSGLVYTTGQNGEVDEFGSPGRGGRSATRR